MSVFLTPGVIMKEISPTTPIQGVSTSVVGFIGIVPRGQRNKAIMVTSWTDYCDKFAYGLKSPFLSNSYLSYAVFGFFMNGGTRCYIVGIDDEYVATSSFSYTDASAVTLMTVSAADPGVWGDKVTTTLATNAGGGYDLTVKYDGTQVSKYTGISLDSTNAKFAETLINGIDRYIVIDVVSNATVKASQLSVAQTLTGGNDGVASLINSDFTDALTVFDNIDDLNILVIPDSQADAIITTALAYCESRKDCVFIFDGESDDDNSGILTKKASFNGTYGALYYPWIKVDDPISSNPVDKTKYIPVCGHVAGAIARTDGERSVYKAPAGTKARIYGALGVKYAVNDSVQETMNPIGINVIRVFKNEGIIIWGARCLDGSTYVNIRRGLNYIKTSLKKGLRWAVFEPNNAILWNKIKTTIESFLRSEYKNNKEGFKGTKAEECFFVKCDSEINTNDTVKLGQVKAQVGVAIAEPGEFLVIEIGQWEGGSSAQEL
jgi:phage tail sheath protein FI